MFIQDYLDTLICLKNKTLAHFSACKNFTYCMAYGTQQILWGRGVRSCDFTSWQCVERRGFRYKSDQRTSRTKLLCTYVQVAEFINRKHEHVETIPNIYLSVAWTHNCRQNARGQAPNGRQLPCPDILTRATCELEPSQVDDPPAMTHLREKDKCPMRKTEKTIKITFEIYNNYYCCCYFIESRPTEAAILVIDCSSSLVLCTFMINLFFQKDGALKWRVYETGS